jgi:hypothetical protein
VNNPVYIGYFTSDNEPGGIDNATHNTFRKSANTAIKMYLSDEKTNMVLIYGECNKKASAVAHLCRHKYFPKNSSFFHNFI